MRATGHVFTRRDVRLFEAAVNNFGTWLTSAIRRLGVELERRGVGAIVRSDSRRLRACRARVPRCAHRCSCFRPAPRRCRCKWRSPWLKLLRPQLRPTDLAGRLTSGEVGILLLQTPQPGAHVVARRLVRVLEAGPRGSEPTVRIGVASQGRRPAFGERAHRTGAGSGAREPHDHQLIEVRENTDIPLIGRLLAT